MLFSLYLFFYKKSQAKNIIKNKNFQLLVTIINFYPQNQCHYGP